MLFKFPEEGRDRGSPASKDPGAGMRMENAQVIITGQNTVSYSNLCKVG